MKKTLLFISLFTIGASFAQDCSKIFISEYVEGWSNNKALEIYNPTSSAVDLSNYVVTRVSNGSAITAAKVENSVQLTGTIQPYDVYVAVLDKRDANGEGQEAPVWDSLQEKADGFYTPVYNTSNAFYWNGNDAVVLFEGSIAGQSGATVVTDLALTIVDIFGKVGQDPGTGWSTDFPYTDGAGTIVTVDHSLIRKSTVKQGETDLAISFFDPLADYDSIPAITYLFDDLGDTIRAGTGTAIKFGNWFSLGSHECACNPVGISEKAQNIAINVYPNPSVNGGFGIKSESGIESIEVYNNLGQLITTKSVSSQATYVEIGNVPGIYTLKIKTAKGLVSRRVIVK